MPDPHHRWTWERALRDRSAAEGMKPAAQHLALVLATYADPAGDGIYPTVETLMKVTGKGRSSILATLKELRESGWVEQESRGSNLSGKASRYVLKVPGK